VDGVGLDKQPGAVRPLKRIPLTGDPRNRIRRGISVVAIKNAMNIPLAQEESGRRDIGTKALGPTRESHVVNCGKSRVQRGPTSNQKGRDARL